MTKPEIIKKYCDTCQYSGSCWWICPTVEEAINGQEAESHG